MGPLLGSGDIFKEGTFGTGSWEVGAGVGEDRIVAVAEVSTKLSVVCMIEDDEKDVLEWAAVVRMAFINSQLFCCFFG